MTSRIAYVASLLVGKMPSCATSELTLSRVTVGARCTNSRPRLPEISRYASLAAQFDQSTCSHTCWQILAYPSSRLPHDWFVAMSPEIASNIFSPSRIPIRVIGGLRAYQVMPLPFKHTSLSSSRLSNSLIVKFSSGLAAPHFQSSSHNVFPCHSRCISFSPLVQLFTILY